MTMLSSRVLSGLLLSACLVGASGCISNAIAIAFTNAPNGGREAVDPERPVAAIYDRSDELEVPGPPQVSLAYWVMEPGPAKVSFIRDSEQTAAPAAAPGWRYVDSKERPGKGLVRTERGPTAPGAEARATVVVLHGWASQVRTTDTLWHLSATLADAGCRVILPDLRGHGDSTGEYVTSGFREVEDLSALLDHVEAQHGPSPLPVGVIGHSYGGGVAIQWAAHDSRVQGVVGLAPLADIRPSMLPGVRAFARQFRPISWFFYLNWAVNQQAINEAQAKIEERTGTDMATNNALYQITRVEVPVLILQGAEDEATPLEGAEKLRDANPDRVELVVYPKGRHTSFLRDDFTDIEPRLRAWVDGLADSQAR
ncbi:alpha/beta hydrolase [Algisphaera agarilytica]|uniref:Pimeloyl-ACP methyl ester carboxylesterase n=1 Tax=Algisphaera agarilytica TaxID=1385975 RepID=A0A7X0H8W3_9BACT|nr:alpha/beta fold hydrolase [Algisphaera agarilytica]MBB6431442.1 pimeloyl-ACP methyl ester carboxylesterase [Algisphaera agarilytica]